MVRIGQAQSRTPAAIERELARIERESAQLAQELRTQGRISISNWLVSYLRNNSTR